MITMRITETELANDVPAVLEKVRLGAEVIIEHENHSAMAVMRKAEPVGRKISECIRILKAIEAERGYLLVPDPDFADDVAAAVAAHREPLEIPEWD